MACYSPEVRVFPFDLDGARRLLAEAGYPGGKGLREITYVTGRRTGKGLQVDSAMVADWRSAGLPVKLVQADWTTMQEMLDRGELPVFSLSWVADLPDPDSFLGTLFGSGAEGNYWKFQHPEVDSLLVLARSTVDLKARQKIYGTVEKIVLKEAPIVPLYTTTSAFGMKSRVHGLELTPLGISAVDLARIWIDKKGDHAANHPR
jgi:ABC-type transport system substrate-binding protein